MKQLILASASPRRKELLEQIGLKFTIHTLPTEENAAAPEPEELVMELSRQKASAVADILSDFARGETVVLGADTIVCHKGKILGKPRDEKDAFTMIKGLSDATHQVYTGVTLLCGQECASFYERTHVTVFPMSDEEIHSYIATGDPMDKAGAYGIQGPFAAYVRGIIGDYNNVVGLPVSRVYQELKQRDWLPGK